MDKVFFDGWLPLLRIAVIGPLAYVALITLLLVTGKRTLSKLNAFDLVVTVSLGSTLAAVLLNRDLPLADGIVAFAVLIGLQFCVTWSSVRSRGVRDLVKAEPSLLLYDGELMADALREQRVTIDEVAAAVRRAGLATLDQADAVVLETDGSLSVITRRADAPLQELAGMDLSVNRSAKSVD